MQALAIRLKEKGLKATPQRIAIYKYLEDSKDHPSAETIYRTPPRIPSYHEPGHCI